MKRALALAFSVLFFTSAFALYESSIQIFFEDDIIQQGGLLQFDINVDKTSGPAGDAQIEYWVESEQGEKWAYGNTSVYIEQSPVSTNISKELYIFSSQPAGTYFLKSVVDMGDFYPTLSQSKQFLVLDREITQVGSVLKIEDYPDDINGEAGWSKLYNVKVQNQGDEIIPNISLMINGIPDNWYSISPPTYYRVQPGAELIFSLRIDIPSDAQTRDYNMTYRVYSTTSAYDEKTSILRVFASTYSLVTNELQKVENDRDSLASAVQDRQLAGYNITTAWVLLSHVNTQIDFAKEYVESGKYDNALMSLASAENLIEQGMVSVQTAERLPVTSGLFDWRFAILIVILIPISFFIYNYWSQRRLARILGYYSNEVMANLKESMPGAKLRMNRKITSNMMENVKEKMQEESEQGLSKKLDRTKKLLRLIERQYSTGSISKESYADIKKGLQKKIEIIEKKLEK